MQKLIGCGALYVVAHLLFGCAANQMAGAPQLGNVPVGASLAKGQLQEIRLLTVDESRATKSYLWLSGRGYAKFPAASGGLTFGATTTPPNLEFDFRSN